MTPHIRLLAGATVLAASLAAASLAAPWSGAPAGADGMPGPATSATSATSGAAAPGASDAPRAAAAGPATAHPILAAAPIAGAAAGQAGATASADAQRGAFQFGVIGHSFKNSPDEAQLTQAIAEADQAGLAFVVATGIKAASESCSDKLYAQRKALFDNSAHPLIVSLAASDWSGCRNSLGRSTAIERLNRLREVFFGDANSLGAHKLELARLSSTATFRSYAENAHWEAGRVLFATINLPANNNHYLADAGRNSEFEDRLVANRAWLKRLFSMAQRRKLAGIVLFSDGDVGGKIEESWSLLPSFSDKQDGFASPRRQIRALAHKFSGQVLLVDTQPASATPGPPVIAWHDNLGHLSINGNWVEIDAAPARLPVFTVRDAVAARPPPR